MFESMLQGASAAGTQVTLTGLLACVAASLAIGVAISLAYMWRERYTRSFVLALAMLPAIVCVTIAMVNGNIGAGVAVTGAFSLVRFRSAPGTGRDIAFVFLAMCAGLVAGMGYALLAATVTAVIGGAYLALSAIGLGGRPDGERELRVTVPESLDYVGLLDDALDAHTARHELVSVRTGAMGTMYKLTYAIRSMGAAEDKALIDEIRCRNGNLEVSMSRGAQQAGEL